MKAFCVVVFSVVLSGCACGGQSHVQEGLTSAQIEEIDKAPTVTVPAEEVILPNGRTLADYAAERGIAVD